MWRNGGRNPSLGSEKELGEKNQWLDSWMGSKAWDGRGRASTDQRDAIKTVEMDTAQPYSYLPPNLRRSSHHQNQPLNRGHQQPITPSPSKTRPIQVRSASPHYSREERSYQSVQSQTPSLRSNYTYNGALYQRGGAVPNYMAATESAKARVRSQSAPRQRPATPERDRPGSVAKKRLSFPVPVPVPDPYNNGNSLRSPSFTSIAGSHVGVEQRSNYSSYCTESIGGEISPSSTTDLRRWLR